MSLSERVAFVTGASQGIGPACALKLATEGAAVAVAARSQEKLNELVSEITTTGGKAAAFALDVTDEEQVKSAVKAAIAQFGDHHLRLGLGARELLRSIVGARLGDLAALQIEQRQNADDAEAQRRWLRRVRCLLGVAEELHFRSRSGATAHRAVAFVAGPSRS